MNHSYSEILWLCPNFVVEFIISRLNKTIWILKHSWKNDVKAHWCMLIVISSKTKKIKKMCTYKTIHVFDTNRYSGLTMQTRKLVKYTPLLMCFQPTPHRLGAIIHANVDESIIHFDEEDPRSHHLVGCLISNPHNWRSKEPEKSWGEATYIATHVASYAEIDSWTLSNRLLVLSFLPWIPCI